MWSVGGVTIYSVVAEHGREDAVGFIIDDGEKKYYVTGDTLYNEEIFEDIPDDVYALFLPINGVGNNMNAVDAARFFRASGAKKAMPYHVGMFDTLSPADFQEKNRVIAKIYEEIEV